MAIKLRELYKDVSDEEQITLFLSALTWGGSEGYDLASVLRVLLQEADQFKLKARTKKNEGVIIVLDNEDELIPVKVVLRLQHDLHKNPLYLTEWDIKEFKIRYQVGANTIHKWEILNNEIWEGVLTDILRVHLRNRGSESSDPQKTSYLMLKNLVKEQLPDYWELFPKRDGVPVPLLPKEEEEEMPEWERELLGVD